MVANIGSSKSLNSALDYNMLKLEKGEAKILATSEISCPQGEAFSRTDIMRDFELFIPQRYRTENPVFHVSLNPHPDDKLSDVELSAIAEEYLERMVYGAQPYVIFKHEDIDRHHIHIVSTRVDGDGRKINDKFERRRSKEITRDLEQKYGLRTAEKQSKSQKSELQMVDISKGDVKLQVENVVCGVNEKYHFISFTEYKSMLSKFNIAAEEVKGSHHGKPFNGIVYSATDDNDRKIGNPFPSTALGKFAGVKALEKKYIASKTVMEQGKMLTPMRTKIDNSFIGVTNLTQLRKNLFDNGVGVVFRECSEGRLYGVTYIDHTTGANLNGSRLGKNYSANMVIERLYNPDSVAHHFRYKIPNKLGGVTLTEQQRVALDLGKSTYIERLINKRGEIVNAYAKCNTDTGAIQFFKRDPDVDSASQTANDTQPQGSSQSQNNGYSQDQSITQSVSFVSGGLDLFDLPADGGDDPEEDSFRRRMQQQQKRKRGIRR